MHVVNSCLTGCPVDYSDLVSSYPNYLKDALLQFRYSETEIDIYRPYIWDKFEEISRLVDDINELSVKWLESDKTEPLFTDKHLQNAIYKIPRWPLYVHLAASIIQMGASGAFHQF